MVEGTSDASPVMKLFPGIFSAAIFALGATIASAQGFGPEVIAHRGFSAAAPENTLSSFRQAIEAGADYFELDVYRSADDSLMLLHDATVNRTTNGTGSVANMTYAQLRALDAGYPSRFGSRYAGEKMPTLYEALALAKGKIKVCIELKVGGLEEDVVRLVERMAMVDDVIVFGFGFNHIQRVKELNPNIKVLFLKGSVDLNDVTMVKGIGGEYLGPGSTPSPDVVDFAHKNGIKVFRYTVNTVPEMLGVIGVNADGIITDTPDILLGLKDSLDRTGLLGRWEFEGTSGSILADSSKYAHNGAITGSPALAAGISGRSMAFDGADDYVTLPVAASLNNPGAQVSISTWVNLAELPAEIPGSFGPIFDSNQDRYVLYLDKGSNELRFKVTTTVSAERPGISAGDLKTGTWVHVAGVYNGSQARIYLNGELKDMHPITGAVATGQVPFIGKNGTTAEFFKGMIDDLRVYNRALGEDEIRAIAQNIRFGPAPDRLSATALSSTSIMLRWNDRTSAETGFVIERRGANGSWAALDSIAANSTSYTDAGLAANSSYSYRLRGFNAAGNTPYSGVATVTTLRNLPGAPADLVAVPRSATYVELSWGESFTDETGFVLERRAGSGSWNTLDTVRANTTSYTDRTAAPATVYHYRARAYNALGVSEISNNASGVTFEEIQKRPAKLTADLERLKNVRLEWDDHSPDETEFVIEQRKWSGWQEVARVPANRTWYVHTPKLLEILNPYRVRAINRLAVSEYSNEACVLGLNGRVIAGNGDLNNGLGLADAPWTGNGSQEHLAVAAAPESFSSGVHTGVATAGLAAGNAISASSVSVSPNPFTTSTRLDVALAMSGLYEISLADMRGATVAVLAVGEMPNGMHQFTIEKGDLPAGAYVIVVKGEKSLLSKIVEIQ